MKHRITLEIQLADLSDKERKELMDLDMSDCTDPDDPEDGLPNASDIGSHELGEMIAGHVEDSNDEIWAGTEMYARIVSVTAIDAELIS